MACSDGANGNLAASAPTASDVDAHDDAGQAPDDDDAGQAPDDDDQTPDDDAGEAPNNPKDGGIKDGAAKDSGEADASTTDAAGGDAGADASVDAGSDASTGPTPAECLEGWRTLNGACPAPVITASYVGKGCANTTGWFIEGANFQLDKRNVGVADDGPQSIGANGNQRHWNVITPTLLCVTVFAGYKDTWVGKTIHVINPDGKASNSVVVGDRL